MHTIQQVTITEHLDAIWHLLEAHRDELATHPDIMPLAPQVELYKSLEAKGKLLSFIVYFNDEPVGYSVNAIAHNLHYGPLLMCQNDVLYLKPDHRGEGVGRALIEATEAGAQAYECKLVLWHAKPMTTLFRVLDAAPYYGVQDIIFGKRLD